MDIGYIHHDDLLRDLHQDAPAETLWEEHGWALSGQQVAAALGLVLLACGVGSLFG